ncbi:MAG: hypothetical protein PHO84_08055 [Dysgonamonadaceae bacterium]|nr:hypothetical protein [Dysgonamonadaceae bacterium]MDD3728176.1 hypothetical protein [Dysgonamonadaceae bacterium]MDD4247089.1 hypothetical protein [Dysgonamonadaceae bacterium]MDD4604712.1 hypothetical protein [Dysgonamonadaceae bacterium]HUI33086.1 hypothetical protein [Dysgonamonadaceae bacterium]
MPYRRLPNTDNARIKALKTAINKCSNTDFNDVVVSMRTLHKAKSAVGKFERMCKIYQQTFDTQIKANKSFQKQIKNARIYLSHFIQVLYLSIIRNEIKPNNLSLYGLDESNMLVPDLSTNEMVLEWGQKIIEGEQKRISNGGVPIYNPTIAKVKVMYSIFKDGYHTQQIHQKATNRTQNEVVNFRAEIDTLILELWDQVENANMNLPAQKKIDRNKEYGIVYYYRKGEALNNAD